MGAEKLLGQPTQIEEVRLGKRNHQDADLCIAAVSTLENRSEMLGFNMLEWWLAEEAAPSDRNDGEVVSQRSIDCGRTQRVRRDL